MKDFPDDFFEKENYLQTQSFRLTPGKERRIFSCKELFPTLNNFRHLHVFTFWEWNFLSNIFHRLINCINIKRKLNAFIYINAYQIFIFLLFFCCIFVRNFRAHQWIRKKSLNVLFFSSILFFSLKILSKYTNLLSKIFPLMVFFSSFHFCFHFKLNVGWMKVWSETESRCGIQEVFVFLFKSTNHWEKF